MNRFGNIDRDDVAFWMKLGTIFIATFGGTFLVWYRMGEVPLKRFPFHPPTSGVSATAPPASEPPAIGVSPSAGTYGDSFGYVNSLLSSLALAGAIAAVILQSIELRAQRKELKQSQRTWQDQAKALRTQSVTMEAQTRVMHEQMLVQQLQNDLAVLQAKTSAHHLNERKSLLEEIDRVQKQINLRRDRENFKTRARAQAALGFGKQILSKKHLEEIGGFINVAEVFLERVAYDMAHSATARQIDVALEKLRVAVTWNSDAEAALTRTIQLIEMIDEQLPGVSPRDEILRYGGEAE